jgi:hypothetical protein
MNAVPLWDCRHLKEKLMPDSEEKQSIDVAIAERLASMKGVHMRCLLSDGIDTYEAYVPLKTIYELFRKEMIEEIKYKGFRV